MTREHKQSIKNEPWEPAAVLAQRLGFPVRSLYAWCRVGLRHSRPGSGRRIYIRETDVHEYLESHTVGENTVAAQRS